MKVVPDPAQERSVTTGEPSARRAVRVGRVLLAAASLALLVVPFSLTVLLVQDRWAPLLRVDQGARDSLHEYAVNHASFVAAMQVISGSGSAVAWTAVLALVTAWLLRCRLPRLALFMVVTAAGSSLLNATVKTVVHRLRPALGDPVTHAHGLSFPSAHAQAAMVGYAVLLLVLLPVLSGAWRRWALTWAVVTILAIGFSRVALGVHYVSDVWGGYVLGVAWVAAMTAAFDVLGVNRQRQAAVRSDRSASDGQSLGGTPGR